MFSLGVSPQEITDVRKLLCDYVYPQSIKLAELTRIIFGTSTDIQQRKVRMAITELRKQGHLIIGKRGYSMAGDDPESVIHFVNGMYSRAHKLTQQADIMYGQIKQRYGDAAKKVQAMPGQTVIAFPPIEESNKFHTKVYNQSEPAFRKSYTREGIENQFQADA